MDYDLWCTPTDLSQACRIHAIGLFSGTFTLASTISLSPFFYDQFWTTCPHHLFLPFRSTFTHQIDYSSFTSRGNEIFLRKNYFPYYFKSLILVLGSSTFVYSQIDHFYSNCGVMKFSTKIFQDHNLPRPLHPVYYLSASRTIPHHRLLTFRSTLLII